MLRQLTVLALLLGTAPAAAGEPPLPRHAMFAGGDTMIARWAPYDIAEHGAAWGLAPIADLIAGADVALANLECVVATGGQPFDKGEGRPYLYRAPPWTLGVLTAAGLDVLATANNHAMDFGPAALLEQNALLRAAGMVPVGSGPTAVAAAAPVYVRVGDTILAFLSMETEFPRLAARDDRAGVFHARGAKAILQALKGPAAEARQRADLVVFTPHWGANGKTAPTPGRVALAHRIIDELGVDAILGHSSHYLQGVELYRGRPIVYDMGSLYFDLVARNEMQYQAGWVLEFDRRGFRRLTIHPLQLVDARSPRARDAALARIQESLRERTAALDPDLAFDLDGDALTVRFDPDPPPPERAADPALIHRAGTTRPLPAALRDRPSSVVRDAPPQWTWTSRPIRLERGVTVLGARAPEAVRPRRGFLVEVALQVAGPLTDGRWVGVVAGERRGGGGRFRWRHPLADGAWIPDTWRPGQIGIDQTLVRPPKVKPGTYDLFWTLGTFDGRAVARPLDPADGDRRGRIPIGALQVLTKGIPNTPAGVAWDGKVPAELRTKLGLDAPDPGAALGLVLPLVSGLLFLGLLLVTRRRLA